MNMIQKENELRLEILTAVARSQRALATMAETVSVYHAHNSSEHNETAHQLQVLARYQISLAEKILGISIRNTRNGTPRDPWLDKTIRTPRQAAVRKVRKVRKKRYFR